MCGQVTAIARFNVAGLLRYLSHAELMRVLQRAAIRAQWPLAFSKGYNPRPKLSLALPKPVGIESQGDLMQAQLLLSDRGGISGFRLPLAKLRDQLPAGIMLQCAWIMPAKTSYQPVAAEYCLPLGKGCDKAQIRQRAASLMERSSLPVPRPNRPGQAMTDVRPFIQQITVDQELCVGYRILDSGTIRPAEIMAILALTPADLDGPIRRRHVKWTLRLRSQTGKHD